MVYEIRARLTSDHEIELVLLKHSTSQISILPVNPKVVYSIPVPTESLTEVQMKSYVSKLKAIADKDQELQRTEYERLTKVYELLETLQEDLTF